MVKLQNFLSWVPLGRERRLFRRLRSNCLVRYAQVSQTGPEATKLTNIKNIGEGGILFTAFEPIPLSSIIKVWVNLPGRPFPVECYAKVMRVQKRSEHEEVYHIGVSFLDMSHENRKALSSHIEEISQHKDAKGLLDPRRWWVPWKRTQKPAPSPEEKEAP